MNVPLGNARVLGVCALFAVFLSTFLAPRSAEAQARFGVRAGVSADPDQFYIGAHGESGPLIHQVRFRPNVEAGFGDNRTVLALNREFVRRFGLDDGYAALVGAGPAIVIRSFDLPMRNETDVGAGFNFLVGLDFPQNFGVELKVGVIDSPQVKFGVSYTFP
jgi:hypothetical protein